MKKKLTTKEKLTSSIYDKKMRPLVYAGFGIMLFSITLSPSFTACDKKIASNKVPGLWLEYKTPPKVIVHCYNENMWDYMFNPTH